eukprot:scaffold24667_cov58-Phaeocystis_antarctica.AAC.7
MHDALRAPGLPAGLLAPSESPSLSAPKERPDWTRLSIVASSLRCKHVAPLSWVHLPFDPGASA